MLALDLESAKATAVTRCDDVAREVLDLEAYVASGGDRRLELIDCRLARAWIDLERWRSVVGTANGLSAAAEKAAKQPTEERVVGDVLGDHEIGRASCRERV